MIKCASNLKPFEVIISSISLFSSKTKSLSSSVSLGFGPKNSFIICVIDFSCSLSFLLDIELFRFIGNISLYLSGIFPSTEILR